MGWRSSNANLLLILIFDAVSRQLECSIKANLTRAHFYGLWVMMKFIKNIKGNMHRGRPAHNCYRTEFCEKGET